MGRDRWHLFDLRNHLGIVSNDWMQMCTRDYSGYEIVLSGFFGSVGIWPNHEVTPEMEEQGARRDGTAGNRAPGRSATPTKCPAARRAAF